MNFSFKAKPASSTGIFTLPDGREFPAICGKNGLCPPEQKREGDWMTPIGAYKILSLFYRHDRIANLPALPQFPLEITKITQIMGWCDDPASKFYNRLLPLPSMDTHEILMRDDSLYDLLLVLDYNYHQPIAGRGSAIFIHLWEQGKTSTKGCIALKRDHLLSMLPFINKDSCRLNIS